MKKYLLVVWGDVEPELLGAFSSEPARDAKAREIRRVNGPNDGIYRLDAEGKVRVSAFSGRELSL